MESRSSILRISDKKTLRLIELYEEEEILWNTELPDYRNRASRFAAAARIATKLELHKFSAKYVIIKFKNLRNSYCQELKKIATSQALNEEPVYKPKVFWFPKMDSFLRPHLQQLHPWDYDIQLKEDGEEMYLDEPPAEFVQVSGLDDVVTVKAEPVDEEDTKTSMIRPMCNYMENDSDNSSGCARSQQEAIVRNAQLRDDCFDAFGKYVSSMLRTMPNQKAMELQPKIVTLLTSVDFDYIEGRVSQSDYP